MESSHMNCKHHESHENRIFRNEKDIQDIFGMVEKNQMSIYKMVGLITGLGVVGNYIIQMVLN